LKPVWRHTGSSARLRVHSTPVFQSNRDARKPPQVRAGPWLSDSRGEGQPDRQLDEDVRDAPPYPTPAAAFSAHPRLQLLEQRIGERDELRDVRKDLVDIGRRRKALIEYAPLGRICNFRAWGRRAPGQARRGLPAPPSRTPRDSQGRCCTSAQTDGSDGDNLRIIRVLTERCERASNRGCPGRQKYSATCRAS
jgi:hypothetical protein